MPNVVFIYIRSHYIYAKRGFSHKKLNELIVVLISRLYRLFYREHIGLVNTPKTASKLYSKVFLTFISKCFLLYLQND